MTLTIPANDHGKLRIFALDFTPPAALRDKTPEGIAGAFGTDALDLTYIDIIDVAALGEMTLIQYLQAGYELKADAVDAAALADVSGWVVMVMSRASGGKEITLDLTDGLTHITTLGEAASLAPVGAPLQSDASQGTLPPPTTTPTKKPKSDARIGGMVATVALLMMGLLVWLMIWIGS